jgi:hypothetical protein
MDYSLAEALPQVYHVKNGKYYDLHWDYRGVEADKVLDEHRIYIEGYIDGSVQVLARNCLLPDHSYGHRSGYVHSISKEAASQLEHAIKKLLHELVTERYKQLEKAEKPDNRLKRV